MIILKKHQYLTFFNKRAASFRPMPFLMPPLVMDLLDWKGFIPFYLHYTLNIFIFFQTYILNKKSAACICKLRLSF